MRLGQRWPVVSCGNVNSRNKCALHKACSQSNCQYGFQQSCTSVATRLGKMPCAAMASIPRLACTPYQVNVSLATVCSQCKREATRKPDSSACATGTSTRACAMRATFGSNNTLAWSIHARTVAGETVSPYTKGTSLLCQSIRRRWFARIGAVLGQPCFQLFDTCRQQSNLLDQREQHTNQIVLLFVCKARKIRQFLHASHAYTLLIICTIVSG